MPVTLTCLQCGAAFDVPPCREKRRKFCGQPCRHKWMSENRCGENHPRYGVRHTPESIAKMAAGQKANARVGPKAANWKGRYLAKGYVMVSQPGGRAIPEHRLVMAEVLGRPLTPDEVVHHINGVKSDNRPENLEIHGTRTHKMTHAELYRELRQLRALAAKCSCGTFPPTG